VSQCGDIFAESGTIGAAWRAGLSGVTPDQIDAGFRAMLDRTDPWPPGVIEFRQLCQPPPIDHSHDWKADKADPRMMPSPERVAWHQGNIQHIQAFGELPRPGVVEPPAPAGAMSFWDIYRAPVDD